MRGKRSVSVCSGHELVNALYVGCGTERCVPKYMKPLAHICSLKKNMGFLYSSNWRFPASMDLRWSAINLTCLIDHSRSKSTAVFLRRLLVSLASPQVQLLSHTLFCYIRMSWLSFSQILFLCRWWENGAPRSQARRLLYSLSSTWAWPEELYLQVNSIECSWFTTGIPILFHACYLAADANHWIHRSDTWRSTLKCVQKLSGGNPYILVFQGVQYHGACEHCKHIGIFVGKRLMAPLMTVKYAVRIISVAP